jgi:hypothetical protein
MKNHISFVTRTPRHSPNTPTVLLASSTRPTCKGWRFAFSERIPHLNLRLSLPWSPFSHWDLFALARGRFRSGVSLCQTLLHLFFCHLHRSTPIWRASTSLAYTPTFPRPSPFHLLRRGRGGRTVKGTSLYTTAWKPPTFWPLPTTPPYFTYPEPPSGRGDPNATRQWQSADHTPRKKKKEKNRESE